MSDSECQKANAGPLVNVLECYQKELDSILQKKKGQRRRHLCLKLEKEVLIPPEERQKRRNKFMQDNQRSGLDSMEWQPLTVAELLTEMSSNNRDWVLINDSGRGKTTFLYSLAVELLKSEASTCFPVVIKCIDLEEKRKESPADPEKLHPWLERQLKKRYPSEPSKSPIKEDWSNLRIFLDGLDQAGDAAQIVKLLTGINREDVFKKARLLISSREVTAHELRDYDFQPVRLCLPEKDEVQEYLGGEEAYNKLRHHLTANREMIRVPMLLEMLKTIADDSGRMADIRNRTELYKQFVKAVKTQEAKTTRPLSPTELSQYQRFLQQDLQEYLEELAFYSLATGQSKIKLDEPDMNFPKKRTPENALTLVLYTDLLKVEGPENGLAFRHQSLQAYFAAGFLKRYPNVFDALIADPEIEKYCHNDVWQEVLVFYVGYQALESPEAAAKALQQLRGKPQGDTSIHSRLFLVAKCLAELPKPTKVQSDEKPPYFEELLQLWKSDNPFQDFISEKIFTRFEGSWVGELLLKELTSFLQNSDAQAKTRLAAMEALGKQSSLPKDILKQVACRLTTQEEKNPKVRLAAVRVFGRQQDLSEKILNQVASHLQEAREQDLKVRLAALRVFGRQQDLSEKILNQVAACLEDSEMLVWQQALGVLGRQPLLPHKILYQVALRLKANEDWKVRKNAVEALGQPFLSKEILNQVAFRLTEAVEKNVRVRCAAVKALGKQSSLKQDILEKVAACLKDQDFKVQRAASRVLRQKSSLPDVVLRQIVTRLQKDCGGRVDLATRDDVLTVLEKQPPLSTEVLKPVVLGLKNPDWNVRGASLRVLNRQGPSLPTEVLQQVAVHLSNPNWYVQVAALEVLGRQAFLSTEEGILKRIAGCLKNNKQIVRLAAMDALDQRPPEFLPQVADCLKDYEWQVRHMALGILRRQPLSTENDILEKIVGCLEDDYWQVRKKALGVLGRQESLSTQILQQVARRLTEAVEKNGKAWQKAVRENKQQAVEKDGRVWQKAVKVLEVIAQKSSLPDAVLLQIAGYLQNTNPPVQAAAVKALKVLGRQSSLPDVVLLQIAGYLQNTNPPVQAAAVKALGQQSSLPEYILEKVADSLEDKKDWNIRFAAVEALENYSLLSEKILKKLVARLDDAKPDVQAAAVKVLENQSSLVKEVLQKIKSKNVQVQQKARLVLQGYYDRQAAQRFKATRLLEAAKREQETKSRTTMIKFINFLNLFQSGNNVNMSGTQTSSGENSHQTGGLSALKDGCLTVIGEKIGEILVGVVMIAIPLVIFFFKAEVAEVGKALGGLMASLPKYAAQFEIIHQFMGH